MKKILIFIFVCMFSVAAFAQLTNEQSANISRAVRQAGKSQQLLLLAKQGKVAAFRKALLHASHEALRAQDAHGNNILHAASSKEMFGFIWSLLDENTREQLLAQKNAAGEIPLMKHIMYGHEDIFLQYFPRTPLYRQLQNTASGLQDTGMNRHIAEIKKADLISQTSIGNQNMWHRAHDLYQSARANGYTQQDGEKMKEVRDMIARTAPFLVQR